MIRPWLVAGLSALLNAQVPPSALFRLPTANPVKTLKDFLQRFKPSDSVLILDDGSESPSSLEALFTQEPLLEWGTTVRTLKSGDPVQQELRERESWPRGLRWAWLDEQGRVRATGSGVFSPRLLADRLREAGYRPRQEVLAEFLMQHQDRADGWADLLNLQRARARRLIRPLRNTAGSPPVRPEPIFGAPALSKPLGDTDDDRIFGPVAVSLERLLSIDGWSEVSLAWSHHPDCPELLSTRMREVARARLPEVEALLRHRPTHVWGWTLWSFLFPLVEGDPSTFLQELVAAPDSTDPVPPDIMTDRLVHQLQGLGRWKALKKLATARWDRFHLETKVVAQRGKLEMFPWFTVFAGLLEAHLRLGERGRADELVRQAAQWNPSKAAWSEFVRLARECGEEGLAAKWELREAKGPPES